ncbi:MAG: 16S rRNA (cytosine(967)-C(5))-methyltransferase RsmB [Clostridia bacterium]|nr:16S rRNA (cytosine(967)-C(5))-methyltransferase RsmB [Clostridia bacterium]
MNQENNKEKKFGKPQGERKSFGDKKPYGDRKPYGDKKSYGDRKPYGDKKSFGDRKPFGDKKPFGDRKPMEDRKPFGDKKFEGERKSFGDKKPYGERKPFGDKKSFGDRKPMGDRKPFGDKKFEGDRKPAFRQDKPFGRPAVPAQTGAVSGGRKVALEVLTEVLHKDGYASLVLDQKLTNANLPQVEKRFCTNLVYSTVENLIRIDFALAGFLDDVDSLEKRVRDILRMSACQLMYMDRVPSSAVVDEAVKLTRHIGMENMTGLVNAVLRNLIRGMNEIKWPTPDEGARYLSIMFSVPYWLAQKLMDAYDPETARKICAFRGEHFMTLRRNKTLVSQEQFEKILEKKVWNAQKGKVLDAWHVQGASEIARDTDYLSGHFSIEGESSMLAAEAMQVKYGMQVLDCCAAPGGKTAYLAEMMSGTGRVYAWDVHEHRVALIRAMMKRLRLENIRPAVRDACQLREDLEGQMDAVLLDAPCSGLGVMDDKPDLKYRVTQESVEELVGIQEKLLDTCCKYVKKGGTLVYSTCSLLPEENGMQIEKFLKNHPEFKLAPLPECFPESIKERYNENGVQILPHLDGLEGFFIARLKRV